MLCSPTNTSSELQFNISSQTTTSDGQPSLQVTPGVLHSHWSRSNQARPSLVKRISVLLEPAIICHKEPGPSWFFKAKLLGTVLDIDWKTQWIIQLKYFRRHQIIFEIFSEFQLTAAGRNDLSGLRSSLLPPHPGCVGPRSLHSQVIRLVHSHWSRASECCSLQQS